MQPSPENIKAVKDRMMDTVAGMPGFPLTDFRITAYARWITCIVRDQTVRLCREVTEYEDIEGPNGPAKWPKQVLRPYREVNDLDYLLELLSGCKFWPEVSAVWDMYAKFAEPDPTSAAEVESVLGVLAATEG